MGWLASKVCQAKDFATKSYQKIDKKFYHRFGNLMRDISNFSDKPNRGSKL